MTRAASHHFQFIAGQLALDFINTVGERLGEAREDLDGPAGLEQWARAAGLVGSRSRLSLLPRDVARARMVREELYLAIHPLALGASLSSRSLVSLNAQLARVAAKRNLRRERGTVAWSWNTSSADVDLILGPVLFSAADLFVSGRTAKIRQCDGEGCGWLFLDRSPAGHRRWCSMADCGNRAKAREHYRRVREAPRRRSATTTHRGESRDSRRKA